MLIEFGSTLILVIPFLQIKWNLQPQFLGQDLLHLKSANHIAGSQKQIHSLTKLQGANALQLFQLPAYRNFPSTEQHLPRTVCITGTLNQGGVPSSMLSLVGTQSLSL